MTDYREFLGVRDLAKEANDGEGVKVAVIDTGIPSVDAIFVSRASNLSTERINACLDREHATFVGSLLFGSRRIIGVCPKATACFCKVSSNNTTSQGLVASAIYHAVDDWHADIVNLSLGFSGKKDCGSRLKKACAYAAEKNVILVAAAGNDGGITMWPAGLDSVISVGSSDGKGKEDFSNVGKIDVVIEGRNLEGFDCNGDITTKTGTSFSTALVSGVIALLIAKHKKNGESCTKEAVIKELISHCVDIGPEGKDPETGYGMLVFVGDKAKKLADLHKSTISAKISSVIGRVVNTLWSTIKSLWRSSKDGQ